MRVQIVPDEADQFGFRVCLINQPLHLLGEVLGGALPGHCHMPPPTLRFAAHKQIPGAIALILVIEALDCARPHRDWQWRVSTYFFAIFSRESTARSTVGQAFELGAMTSKCAALSNTMSWTLSPLF